MTMLDKLPSPPAPRRLLPLAATGLLALTLLATPAPAQDGPAEDAVEASAASIDAGIEAAATSVEVAEAEASEEITAAEAEARSEAAFAAAEITPGQFRSNNLWILIAAALVFTMHLGFGCVESGLTRAKNSVNVLTKNLWIICTGILLYWVAGFNAHYPEGNWLIGEWFPKFGTPFDGSAATNDPGYNAGYTIYGDFIFQAMFAATAATIVSGAVAERIKLAPFMVFAVVFVGFGYPFVGSWHWGLGWLNNDDAGLSQMVGAKFYDFAGSSVVHAFGGFGALAGVLLLGPRIGKYGPDGSPRAIPGHNIPLVNIGVFLLFLGWFGFNGGSVLSADETLVGLVFVTTTLAGVTGGMIALLTSWGFSGKPDLTMGLNGMLAGLVGITAGADSVTPFEAIIIGAIAGVLVVVSVLAFDRIKIDDPVGAISVHGVCGIWGTLAVGIFGEPSFVAQLIGTVAVSVTAFLIALVIFGILKVLGGIRVSEQEEIEGLDLGEHGMSAYHTLDGRVTA